MKLDDFVINEVYFVSEKNQIAIRPHVIEDSIEWGNKSSGDYIDFAVLKFDGKDVNEIDNPYVPTKIEIIAKDKQIYSLVPLTIEIFEKSLLKTKMAGGESMDFKNTKDLREYFLNTNFESY